MRRSILGRCIAVVLCFSFACTQVSFAVNMPVDTLSPSIVSDDINPGRSNDVKFDIAAEAEPGAIGKGQPRLDMMEGMLPYKIDISGIPLSEVLLGRIPKDAKFGVDPAVLLKLEAGLNKAIMMANEKFDKIPEIHKARAKTTMQNLAATIYNLRNAPEKVHLFNAVVINGKNYLLGFNYNGTPGLAIELINELNMTDLAEYLFHEHTPEDGMVGHKDVYEDIQAPIFWAVKGNTLGLALGKFVRDYKGTASHVAQFIPAEEEQAGRTDIPLDKRLRLLTIDHTYRYTIDAETKTERVERPGDILKQAATPGDGRRVGESVGIFPTSFVASTIKLFRDLRKLIEFERNAQDFKKLVSNTMEYLNNKGKLSEYEKSIVEFLGAVDHIANTTGLTEAQLKNVRGVSEDEHTTAQDNAEKEIREYLGKNRKIFAPFMPLLADPQTAGVVTNYLPQAQGLYGENAVLAAYFRAFRVLSFSVFACEKEAVPPHRIDRVGADPLKTITLGLYFYRAIYNAKGARELLGGEQGYLLDTGRVNYESNLTRFFQDEDGLIHKALTIPDNNKFEEFVRIHLKDLANILSSKPYVGKTEGDQSHSESAMPNGFTVISLIAALDGQEIARRADDEAKKATSLEDLFENAAAKPEWALDICRGLDEAVRQKTENVEDLSPVDRLYLGIGNMLNIAGSKFSPEAVSILESEGISSYFLKAEETIKARTPHISSVRTRGAAHMPPPTHYTLAMPTVWKFMQDATVTQYDALRNHAKGIKNAPKEVQDKIDEKMNGLKELIQIFGKLQAMTQKYEGNEIEQLIPIKDDQLNRMIHNDWVLTGKVADAKPVSAPLHFLAHDRLGFQGWVNFIVAGAWKGTVPTVDGKTAMVSGYDCMRVITKGSDSITTVNHNDKLNNKANGSKYQTEAGVKSEYNAEHVVIYRPEDVKRKKAAPNASEAADMSLAKDDGDDTSAAQAPQALIEVRIGPWTIANKPTDTELGRALNAATPIELAEKIRNGVEAENVVGARDSFIVRECMLDRSPNATGYTESEMVVRELTTKLPPDLNISELSGEAIIRWLTARRVLSTHSWSKIPERVLGWATSAYDIKAKIREISRDWSNGASSYWRWSQYDPDANLRAKDKDLNTISDLTLWVEEQIKLLEKLQNTTDYQYDGGTRSKTGTAIYNFRQLLSKIKEAVAAFPAEANIPATEVADMALAKEILQPSTLEGMLEAQDANLVNMVCSQRRLLERDLNTDETKNDMHILALDTDLGSEDQRTAVFNFLRELKDELEKKGGEGDLFSRLLIIRGSGQNGFCDQIERLSKERNVRPGNIIVIAKQLNIDEKRFTKLEGEALIAAMEDRGMDPCTYLPIPEAITVAMNVAYGADYASTKALFDRIVGENNALTEEGYRLIVASRIIKILPRALAFDIGDMPKIFERAIEALRKA